MPSLVVRKLDPDLIRRLKARAAAHGRSAEAEHRAILEATLRPAQSGAELWARLAEGERMQLDEAPDDMDETPRPAEVD